MKTDNTAQPPQLTPGRLLRINQFIPFFLPIAKSVFWAGVKTGKYPQPIKLSERITCWKSEDIMALLDHRGQTSMDGALPCHTEKSSKLDCR